MTRAANRAAMERLCSGLRVAELSPAELDARYQRTARMYVDTHGGAPAPGALVEMVAPSPFGDLAELGALHVVEYVTRKDHGPAAGKVAIHRHVFKAGREPVLSVNADGRLLILGGGYVVTRRGIEG